MPGTTPVYGFPYPEPTDLVADYPALGQNLAEDIEAVLPTLGGLTLISPTSIANTGGSATSSNGTVTFTGVSNISLNGVFSSTYENALVLWTLSSLVNNDTFFMRLRASGSDNASSYRTETIQNFGSTVSAAQNPNGDGTKFTVVGNIGNASAGSTAAEITLTRPGIAARTVGFHRAFGLTPSAVAVGWTSSYWHDVATAYDGLSIFTSSGGGMTGKVRVYGFRGA